MIIKTGKHLNNTEDIQSILQLI